jgi:hypothetical protein
VVLLANKETVIYDRLSGTIAERGKRPCSLRCRVTLSQGGGNMDVCFGRGDSSSELASLRLADYGHIVGGREGEARR